MIVVSQTAIMGRIFRHNQEVGGGDTSDGPCRDMLEMSTTELE